MRSLFLSIFCIYACQAEWGLKPTLLYQHEIAPLRNRRLSPETADKNDKSFSLRIRRISILIIYTSYIERENYNLQSSVRHRLIVDMDIKEKKISAESTTNGYKKEDVKEVQIPMPWGHIRGKWWGPADKQPIVAIHGWQDNSGTFDNLAQLLPNVAVLSIDLPGHGLSSHLPLGQFYYVFWDGVLALRRIVKYYKWNKVKLLGHSLGGAISFLYAASYPDEVDVIISLDIVSPSVRDVKKTATATGEYIDKFLKYESLTLDNVPCYKYDEMLEIVEKGYNGSITSEGAKILMKRGMQPAYKKDEYYFSRDPRLKVSLLGMLSLDLVLEYASLIKCAYLNIRAIPGMKFEHPENYQKVLDIIKVGARKFEYHEVMGTHHVHLNEPEKIASIIKNFLQN